MDQRILQIIQKHPELKPEFEEIYPELKESEDERIRKDIIQFFKDAANSKTRVICSNTFAKWATYLEKQKEQKSEIKYVYPKFRVGDEIVEITPNGYCPPIVVKYIGEGAYICKSKDGKCFLSFPIKKENEYRLVDQKPVKWSEKDDAAHTRVIGALAKAFRGILPTKPLEEDIEWFKSLPERFNLQPKQEWSEEDKKLLDFWSDVIDRNDWRMDENFCKASREFINRLKSLRPSWKPSEEQMEEMRKSIAYWQGISKAIPSSKLLESLYNDLQKLY